MRYRLPGMLLPVILFILNPQLFGQTELVVSTRDEIAHNLLVYHFNDYITWQKAEDADIVLQPGSEEIISVKAEYAGITILRYGSVEYFVIAEPGNRIRISLPAFREMTPADRNNPYFTFPRVPLVCSGEGRLNNDIMVADSAYSRFARLITNDIYYGVKKTDTDSLLILFSGITRKSGNDFYLNWAASRSLSLKNLAMRNLQARREALKYLNKNFDCNNQASVSLVEELFKGSLTMMLSGSDGNEIRALVNSGTGFTRLADTISSLSDLTNNSLSEFIVLDNLYDEYYGKSFGKQSVYNMVLDAFSNATSRSVRETAARILIGFNRLKPGTKPPPFKLNDDEGNLYSSDSLKRKYTILSFGGSSSWQSISEYNLLRSWIKDYLNDVRVVTIVVDDDFDLSARKFRNLGFDWLLLDGSGHRRLKEAYDVRFLPSFYLLGRDGNILAAPAPYPSENLKSLLGRKLQDDFIENVRHR